MAKKAMSYKSKKSKYKGITFDSKLERDFYIYCDECENIDILKVQPQFTLYQAFVIKNPFNKSGMSSVRKAVYTSDFKILVDGQKYIVELKGYATPEYKLRKKIFLNKYIKDQDELIFLEVKDLKKFKEVFK